VTGVQTCALPICRTSYPRAREGRRDASICRTRSGTGQTSCEEKAPYPQAGTRSWPSQAVGGQDRRAADETGLKVKAVQKAMAKLRDAGWINYHPMKYMGPGPLRYMTVAHVWLDDHGRRQLAAAKKTRGEALAICLYKWAMEAINGDLNAGLVLSRLWYLIARRGDDGWFLSKPDPDGEDPNARWLVVTAAELAEWLSCCRRRRLDAPSPG